MANFPSGILEPTQVILGHFGTTHQEAIIVPAPYNQSRMCRTGWKESGWKMFKDSLLVNMKKSVAST